MDWLHIIGFFLFLAALRALFWAADGWKTRRKQRVEEQKRLQEEWKRAQAEDRIIQARLAQERAEFYNHVRKANSREPSKLMPTKTMRQHLKDIEEYDWHK